MVATGGGVLFAVCPSCRARVSSRSGGRVSRSAYASLASIVAALALPVAAAGFGYPVPVIVFAAAGARGRRCLHRANLRRLARHGTKYRFTRR